MGNKLHSSQMTATVQQPSITLAACCCQLRKKDALHSVPGAGPVPPAPGQPLPRAVAEGERPHCEVTEACGATPGCAVLLPGTTSDVPAAAVAATLCTGR